MNTRQNTILLAGVALLGGWCAPTSAGPRVRPATAPSRAARLVPRPPAPELQKSCLEIPGIKTPATMAAVLDALRQVPGVRFAVADLNTKLAVVDYVSGGPTLQDLLTACEAAGFTATEYRVEERFPRPIRLKGG